MLPLIATVFAASLLGSLHCVGMCGPLAILASNGNQASGGSAVRRKVNFMAVLAYHGSRLISYSIAGVFAGVLGAGLQHTGSLLGMQRLAAQLAGGSMLVIGLLGLIRLAGGGSHSVMLPSWVQSRLARGHAWARRQPAVRRAATIGLLTAILPCGWLYAFLIVAAGTASPVEGMLVMAMFSLGSVPALAGMAMSVTLLIGRFRTAIPWCSAALVTIVGASTVMYRSQVDLDLMNRASAAEPKTSLNCQVENIDQTTLPCCCKKPPE